MFHDRQTTLEEKKQKRGKLPQHFIESEEWDEEECEEEEIQILEELVDEYINIDIFDDVLPCYGTIVIESFNHF